MIIWLLNHYAISPKSTGGTRHFDLAQKLAEKGHTVRIFASSFNHFERRETVTYDNGGIYSEEIFENVNFVWIKTPPYNNLAQRITNILSFSIRLNRVLNAYLKKETPELILGSSVHPLTPLIGIKKSKKAKSLFYFEERDLWPQTFIDFGIISEKNIIAKLLFKMEKYLYRESDRVIFLFEKANNYALSKGLESGKSIYLPNGYSAERVKLNSPTNEVDRILAPLKGLKICIYIGSMGEANHMFPLIELAEAMQSEEKYHFLFIGSGPLKTALLQYKKEKDLSNVTFHAPIPKRYIPYLLNFASFGLISMKDSPLYKWGFSMNKIYDYLSAGLPIIMFSNLKDIGNLENSKAVYNSNSIEELKTILIESPVINRTEIMNFADQNYSWEVLSTRLLDEVEKDIK
ncbi:hypothetical protein AM499_12090 [Bacillus sp. FJAT-22090]|uniref:glycosyltransferase family 4 protein n=1 Tax=Bacillus sp. FJAT-22090 TaxID=1581038 RepID=UPI0006B019E8|nr:glycosyltransferase family 4 protein [Bacillus sp. FJAT-22090]ALC86484.1 hypothetical protein AM499_12090 [Bacillus sp. FJAT-22090]